MGKRKAFVTACPIWKAIPVSTWSRNLPGNYLFPFYHVVTDDYLPHIHPLYRPKTIAQFQDDLTFLLNHFEPVSLEQVLYKKKTKTGKPGFHLSFDDGLAQFNDVIAPVLRSKGIPATCFVNSEFMDNRRLMYRYKVALLLHELKRKFSPARVKGRPYVKWPGLRQALLKLKYEDQTHINHLLTEFGIDYERYLAEQKPYLSRAQMIDLSNQGFTFGAHSATHPRFSELSPEAQKEEVTRCLDYLDVLGQKVRVFSFPFTDVDVKEESFAFIRGVTDMSFGCAGIKPDRHEQHFQRIDMETGRKTARQLIANDLLYQRLLNILGKK